MASNSGESSTSNPQNNISNSTPHSPETVNETRIVVEDLDERQSLNQEPHPGTNQYSPVRNGTPVSIEENVSSLLRRASSELERRGSQNRVWRLNLSDVLQRVRESTFIIQQNTATGQVNNATDEPSQLTTGRSNDPAHLENGISPRHVNTNGTTRQVNPTPPPPVQPSPSVEPNTNQDQPRRLGFSDALAEAPPEIREIIYGVLRYLPFVLILISRPLIDHFGALIDMVKFYALFSCTDTVFMKQVTRQTVYRKSYFFFNFIVITSCCSFFATSWSDYLNLLLLNPRMKGPISMGTLIYSTFLTDCFLRAMTVLFKNCVLALPECLMQQRKRGRYYMLIEASSQLYRYLAPVQIWLLYVTGTNHVAFQIVGVICYLALKMYFSSDHLMLFKKAVVMFPNRVQYGIIPKQEDLDRNGGDCSICQDRFTLPVMLNCHHIFCEQCLSGWLRRKANCPMCRASVGQISWMLGRNSEYIQLF